MPNPLKPISIVIILAATASSNALIEQVVNAQNMTENNNTDDNSTNKSGIISSLPMPIRPPYASN